MDELNKNENEQEMLDGTEEIAQDEIPAQPEDKLMEELEDIREMFQNELDGTGTAELIQELDEIEEADEKTDEEPVEVSLCECCGERERDVSFGEDYPYCTECRNLMKSNPIRFTSVFTVMVMIAVAFFSLYFFAQSIDDYTSLLAAEEAYSQNNLSDAEQYYQSYFDSKTSDSNISRKALRNFLEISMKLGYYNYANDLVEKYFSESQLKLPWNKKYASISGEYEKLVNTSTAINDILGEVLYYNVEFDLDKKLKELDALLETKEGEEDGKYSEILVEYYKFAAMNIANVDNKKQLEQLKKVAELDDGSYAWIYLRNITELAARSGDIELTQKYADQCIELNAQEFSAYNSLANAYRFSGDLNADKMIELAEKAQKATPAQAAPTYYQIYAMAYLLQGKNDEAVKAMESYNATQQYSVQSVNLYALCCLAVNDSEGYAEAKSILSSGGYDIADVVKKYEKGKLTIEQVLSDNGGEI